MLRYDFNHVVIWLKSQFDLALNSPWLEPKLKTQNRSFTFIAKAQYNLPFPPICATSRSRSSFSRYGKRRATRWGWKQTALMFLYGQIFLLSKCAVPKIAQTWKSSTVFTAQLSGFTRCCLISWPTTHSTTSVSSACTPIISPTTRHSHFQVLSRTPSL